MNICSMNFSNQNIYLVLGLLNRETINILENKYSITKHDIVILKCITIFLHPYVKGY